MFRCSFTLLNSYARARSFEQASPDTRQLLRKNSYKNGSDKCFVNPFRQGGHDQGIEPEKPWVIPFWQKGFGHELQSCLVAGVCLERTLKSDSTQLRSGVVLQKNDADITKPVSPEFFDNRIGPGTPAVFFFYDIEKNIQVPELSDPIHLTFYDGSTLCGMLPVGKK